MAKERDYLTVDESGYEVSLAARRIALLHLAYARAITEKLGEEKGKSLIGKAIKSYGRMVGEEVKQSVEEQGLPLTPENYGSGSSRRLSKVGMYTKIEKFKVGGETHLKVDGCVLADVWREYEDYKLGRLYCYVDPAKYMAYNPNYKLGHIKTLPDGDSYCELCIRKTSQKEKDDFSSDDRDWFYIDECR